MVIVPYDENFGEKRVALAKELRDIDSKLTEDEAQKLARGLLLKKMANDAYAREGLPEPYNLANAIKDDSDMSDEDAMHAAKVAILNEKALGV